MNLRLSFPYLFTFAIAGVGVLIFLQFSLPLPWLLGPIASCLIAALLGVKMKSVGVLNQFMRTILGVAVGATFTPMILTSILGFWSTLLLIPIMTFLIVLISVPFLQKVCGFDFITSYYASVPGGLQDMLVFGEEAGGDVRAISLIHATRVVVIVFALSFLLQYIWQADLNSLPGKPATNLPYQDLFLMLACSIVGWKVAAAVGMFGASILGPMICAGLFSIAGFLENRPPAEAIWAAQFFIGVTVGTTYVGITLAEIKRDIVAGLSLCLILLLLTAAFFELIIVADLAQPMDALLAFTPGGQAEITVLAIVAGADVAFVIAHHVLRLFVVLLGAPVFSKIMEKILYQFGGKKD